MRSHSHCARVPVLVDFVGVVKSTSMASQASSHALVIIERPLVLLIDNK